MKINKHKLKHGYKFKQFAGQPITGAVRDLAPERVIIPMLQGTGRPVQPLVKRGDQVKRGQIIGRDDNTLSHPVHTSLSGTVHAVKKVDTPEGNVTAVFITGQAEAGWQVLEGATTNWQSLPSARLEELIYLAGAAACGPCGIPTQHKSAAILPNEVEHIIIRQVAADIYNLSLAVLLEGERFESFLTGLLILQKLMPQANIHIVMDDKQIHRLEQIDTRRNDPKLRYHTLPGKYPAQQDEVLIPLVLNQPFPYGFTPAQSGVIPLDPQALIHVAEAVTRGKPVLERIIPLSGPCVRHPGHYRVPVGMPVADITSGLLDEEKPARLLFDSVLTGTQIPDPEQPFTRNHTQLIALQDKPQGEFMAFARPGFRKDSISNTFLAKLLPIQKLVDSNMHGETRACLSCGYCSDVCPTGLLPQLLHRYVDKKIFDENLLTYKIAHCIECNLCTYVCTSKIDVAGLIRQGKEGLRKEGYDIYQAIRTAFQLKGLTDDESGGDA